MLHPPRPGGTLNVDEDPWSGVLQLDHNNGLQVSQLVPVGKEVRGEAPPGGVGHGADVLLVRVVFSVAMQPGHVEIGAVELKALRAALGFVHRQDMVL